jgi:glycosyltransferase involved in cell wall biosynthesis
MKISVILPAYNEACNIERCVFNVLKVLNSLNLNDWEVVIVNDGSKDQTGEIVRNMVVAEPRIRLIQHDVNKGYGEALRSGLSNAKLDWIFITDSDLQFFIEDIETLIPLTQASTFVQGYRINRRDPAFRVILGKVYKVIVHTLFKVPVSDPECSFRLFKRHFIDNIEIICNGPLVSVELIMRANKLGAVFSEVAVRHRLREQGEANALTFKSLVMLLKDFFTLFIDTQLIRKS